MQKKIQKLLEQNIFDLVKGVTNIVSEEEGIDTKNIIIKFGDPITITYTKDNVEKVIKVKTNEVLL